MTPSVRVATEDDAQSCQELEQQAQGNNAGARGAAAFFAEQPISFISDGAGGFTLIVEVDSVAVGFATVRISNVAGSNVATVVRVFVTARARRVGVGDALINAAKQHAREANCVRIDALSLPGDRDTKNLYERNGLTARLIVATSTLD
jgi:GNAT superfamily N-acetyltransferase